MNIELIKKDVQIKSSDIKISFMNLTKENEEKVIQMFANLYEISGQIRRK